MILNGVLHVVGRVLPVVQAPRRPESGRVRRARWSLAVVFLRLGVRQRRGRGRGRVVAVTSGTLTGDSFTFLSSKVKHGQSCGQRECYSL